MNEMKNEYYFYGNYGGCMRLFKIICFFSGNEVIFFSIYSGYYI